MRLCVCLSICVCLCVFVCLCLCACVCVSCIFTSPRGSVPHTPCRRGVARGCCTLAGAPGSRCHSWCCRVPRPSTGSSRRFYGNKKTTRSVPSRPELAEGRSSSPSHLPVSTATLLLMTVNARECVFRPHRVSMEGEL